MASSSSSKKIRDPTRESDEIMTVIPLGAGQEIGRSCVYLSFKSKHILFDCGIHPAYSGKAALPYFQEIDPSTIDVLLITNFHLDHAGSLPYFLEKTHFKGRVFMTDATKAIYMLLLTDYVKACKVSAEDKLFDEQDIFRSMDKIEVIDFDKTLEVNGIKFWCYRAGHALGAAMFMVDIAGVRILYTGNYSREEDHHLKAAEVPQFSPDVCIIESTSGVQLHEPIHVREKKLTDVIRSAVSQGGRVLIPAFALGHAQEILLFLDEYWSNHPELQKISIYHASPLARRSIAVYQSYINSMNERIRKQFEKSNPFDFKYVSLLKSIDDFKDVGPSVMIATPGSLQGGMSRQLFEKWFAEKENVCVIPGYVVEGTLAKTVINKPKTLTFDNRFTTLLSMQAHHILFSAHSDYAQTANFLQELNPPNAILVNGPPNEMGQLKRKLSTNFIDRYTKLYTPKNRESVELQFNVKKMAKAIGKLGEVAPENGGNLSGLLVRKDSSYRIMAPDDLHVHTKLSTADITQRITIPYSGELGILKHKLKQIYQSVESSTDEESGVPTLQVHERVTVRQDSENYLSLQWTADPLSDMVSDSVVTLVLKLNTSQKVVQEVEVVKDEEEEKKKTDKKVYAMLLDLFGNVKYGEDGRLVISVDGNVAYLDKQNGEVECGNEDLKKRVKVAFTRIRAAVMPIPVSGTRMS